MTDRPPFDHELDDEHHDDDWDDDPFDDDPFDDAHDEREYVELPRSSSRRRRVLTVLAGVAVILLVAVVGVGVWVSRQIDPPGDPGEPRDIEIPEGSTVGGGGGCSCQKEDSTATIEPEAGDLTSKARTKTEGEGSSRGETEGEGLDFGGDEDGLEDKSETTCTPRITECVPGLCGSLNDGCGHTFDCGCSPDTICAGTRCVDPKTLCGNGAPATNSRPTFRLVGRASSSSRSTTRRSTER